MSNAPSSEGLNFPSPTEVLPSYEPGTHDSPISLRPATLADAKFRAFLSLDAASMSLMLRSDRHL